MRTGSGEAGLRSGKGESDGVGGLEEGSDGEVTTKGRLGNGAVGVYGRKHTSFLSQEDGSMIDFPAGFEKRG